MYKKCEARAKFVCLLKLLNFVCLFFSLPSRRWIFRLLLFTERRPHWFLTFGIGLIAKYSWLTRLFQVWGPLFAGCREPDRSCMQFQFLDKRSLVGKSSEMLGTRSVVMKTKLVDYVLFISCGWSLGRYSFTGSFDLTLVDSCQIAHMWK